MELSWFRQPAGDDPGSLNLCYNALDRHVVHGRAEAPAVRAEGRTLDFATLLEHTAALAGAMRSLGVAPGVPVAADLDEGLDRLLVLLAALRLGAVYVEGERAGVDRQLVVEPGTVQPAVRAARDDPAPSEALAPRSTAFVALGDEVALVEAPGHPSWMGEVLASLCAGSTLTFSTVAESA